MVGQSACHRWRLSAKRFVLPGEIVPRDEQRGHGRMVTPAFAVSIGQPRVAPAVHPNRQVEPFAVAGAHFIQIRVAESRNDFDAAYRRRAVPRFVLAARIAFH